MRDRKVCWRPEIQEHAGPGGRVVFPELLKVFLEMIGTDSLEVVAEQISQAELLLGGEIFFALQNAPERLFQQRRVALLAILRDSAARTSSKALFILATMWKRSRMCSALEHFWRITSRYGCHISEQTNSLCATSFSPMRVKNPWKDSMVRSLLTQSRRVSPWSI